MSEQHYYFAFGSNMDVDRLATKRLEPKGCKLIRRVSGRLDGWQLDFSVPSPAWQGCGVGNCIKKEGATTWGTLNQVCSGSFDCLDVFEAVAQGMYRRVVVDVFSPELQQTVRATMYVGCCDNMDPSLKPSKKYLGYLLCGRDVLPKEYVEYLENIDAVEVEADRSHFQK